MRSLRDFGFGKADSMEALFHQEVAKLGDLVRRLIFFLFMILTMFPPLNSWRSDEAWMTSQWSSSDLWECPSSIPFGPSWSESR